MPFRALGLEANILRAVQDAGYTEPTPIQTAAIPPILAGHDLIGIAQTGTGKTAAFTLPMLTKLGAADGATWNAGGASPSAVVLRVYSTGTNVYVGGNYLAIGGAIMAGLAGWDGGHWTPVGPAGKIAGLNTSVRAIGGTGTNLIVGGSFTYAGQTNALRVGRYNGTNWATFGNGLNDDVTSIAVIGTNIYAGGDFTGSSGGPLAFHLARWDGSTWPPLNGTSFSKVTRLATRNNDLFVTGYFTISTPGGNADWLARWDGTNFSPVLAYPPTTFYAYYLDNVGITAIAIDGTNIYLSGHTTISQCDSNLENCVTTSNVMRFDGTYVRTVGSGLNTNANAIAVMGTNIFFAGPFTFAGSVPVNRIARWNGVAWSDVGGGMVGTGVINALAVIGTNLYVGGSFTNMGNVPVKRIAKWNGSVWSPLGSGTAFSATAGPVLALTAIGQDLYVGGTFRIAGDKPSYYLARWNESLSFVDPVIRFSGPGKNGGGFFTSTITADGVPTWVVERSTNFTNWARVLTSSVSPIILVDSNAPAGPKQFYRALSLP